MPKPDPVSIWEKIKPFVLLISPASGILLIAYGIDNQNGIFLLFGGFLIGSTLQKLATPIKDFLKNH